MNGASRLLARTLRSPDLRILSVMVAGVAIFGLVDGSSWQGLLAPTIAYRPAILFALTLVLGWRGFVWSQVVFLAAFWVFLGWRGAVFLAPLYALSHALGFVVARQLARNEPWFSRERSTVAFLAGAALAPAIPALLQSVVYRFVGIKLGPGVPAAVDSWLRGSAAILALAPAILVYCSGPLRKWIGFPPDAEWDQPITKPRVLEIAGEVGIWTATLWITVHLKARYGLNVTYISFLPPLAFTLLRGMGFASLMLLANAVMATTAWQLLHWSDALSVMDLRLLIAIYSLTTLVLAAVVHERQRGKVQIEKLLAAEAELRENEQRLDSIYNTVRDIIFHLAVEPQGQFRFLSVNAAFLRVTGLSREMVVGRMVNEVIPEPSLSMVLGKYREAVEEHTVVVWEETSDYPIGRLTGKVSVAPVFDDKARCTHLVGSVHDITELVNAERLLRESEQRLKSAQELARIGSWHWDIEADRVFCSEECLRIFGQTHDFRPTMEALIETITPRDRQRVARELEASVAQKNGCSTEFQIAWPSGEFRTITFASRVLVNDEGLPRHVFGACQDVTDMRRAQEEAFARQKLETLGTLANGIAHDFNNLLGAIVAQADLAFLLTPVSPPNEQLKAIQDVAMRGSEIVRELMIYAGTESQTLVTLDVSRVIKGMQQLLKVSVSKHVTVEVELAGDLPPVRANSARMSQLLMNLVTNASDAIGDGPGVIRIITRRVTARGGDQANKPSSEGDHVQLEISDTGHGMTRETQARAFEPFFSTKSTGRGLGLAVVQGIVRSLGGEIEVDSDPGEGTRIRVSLPSAQIDFESVQGTIAHAIEPATDSRVRTVLLVEDEHPLRQALAQALSKAGIAVIEAADGSVALDVIRDKQRPIDVLILDITIPQVPSRKVFAEARSLRPDMRVLVTSAYPHDLAAASLQSSIPHFIRKPYRLSRLLELIRHSPTQQPIR